MISRIPVFDPHVGHSSLISRDYLPPLTKMDCAHSTYREIWKKAKSWAKRSPTMRERSKKRLNDSQAVSGIKPHA